MSLLVSQNHVRTGQTGRTIFCILPAQRIILVFGMCFVSGGVSVWDPLVGCYGIWFRSITCLSRPIRQVETLFFDTLWGFGP